MNLRLVTMAAILLVSAAHAQTIPTYEVASVKESRADAMNGRMLFGDAGVSVRNMPLKPVVSSVYGVRQDLISGLPGWAETTRFDIEAKEDEDTIAAQKKMTKDERLAQQKLMMQALLAERFRLKATVVDKTLPTYEMVVARGGFKLKDADPANDYANGMKIQGNLGGKGMMMNGNGQITGQAVKMTDLAGTLAYSVGRTVIDRTGLAGNYDFTLKFNPSATDAGSDLPDLLTALEEQLGVKLVPSKAATRTLAVESIEKPTGN